MISWRDSSEKKKKRKEKETDVDAFPQQLEASQFGFQFSPFMTKPQVLIQFRQRKTLK